MWFFFNFDNFFLLPFFRRWEVADTPPAVKVTKLSCALVLCACGGGGKECKDKSDRRPWHRSPSWRVCRCCNVNCLLLLLCVLLYEAKCLHTEYACMVSAFLWVHVFLSVFGLKSIWFVINLNIRNILKMVNFINNKHNLKNKNNTNILNSN